MLKYQKQNDYFSKLLKKKPNSLQSLRIPDKLLDTQAIEHRATPFTYSAFAAQNFRNDINEARTCLICFIWSFIWYTIAKFLADGDAIKLQNMLRQTTDKCETVEVEEKKRR